MDVNMIIVDCLKIRYKSQLWIILQELSDTDVELLLFAHAVHVLTVDIT